MKDLPNLVRRIASTNEDGINLPPQQNPVQKPLKHEYFPPTPLQKHSPMVAILPMKSWKEIVGTLAAAKIPDTHVAGSSLTP
jgi:hypothetical protein